MTHRAFRLVPIVAILVCAALTVGAWHASAEETIQRTWKTLSELSEEELQSIDQSTNTPRHPEVPYLPAEAYPFKAPYTAEEMGYRAMEYNPRQRWSGVVANTWGSIGDSGVLLNPGKSITFVNYAPSMPGVSGVKAYLELKPGEEIYRSLSQGVAPPAAEGSQWIAIRYRTDKEFYKKEERFRYSPSIRRVRHQVPGRRQSRYPNMAMTRDDSFGRDAWEFSWRIIGTDVLYQGVRFPNTRPTVILRDVQSNEFREHQTQALKLMGESYAHYTAHGGVECYVIEAVSREDWIPDYYAPRMLFWVDKHSFFPLRSELYDPAGKLMNIEVRMGDMFNPGLAERGYATRFLVHWHMPGDIMSYLVNDSHKVIDWDDKEAEIYFNPDFMRRQWYLDTSIKTQAEVKYPEEFFLRPAIDAEKFPNERSLELSAAMQAKVDAQEAAGRLVFQGDELPVQVATQEQPVSLPEASSDAEGVQTKDASSEDTSEQYVQSPETTSTTLR